MVASNYKEPSTILFSGFAAFRTVVLIVMVMALVWIGLSVSHYIQAKEQIRLLLQRQAQEMASMLALGDKYMSQVLDRLEDEQGSRMAVIGSWLRDIDARKTLTVDDLERVAAETKAFNIVLFNSDGVRETGLRGGPGMGPGMGMGQGMGMGMMRRGMGPGPGAGMGRMMRGGGMMREEIVKNFLHTQEMCSMHGFHQRGPFRPTSMTVLVRRDNGGAIMIDIDADAQDQMLRELGPEALLQDFASRPGIVYVQRLYDNDIDIQFGETPERQNTGSEDFSALSDPSGNALISLSKSAQLHPKTIDVSAAVPGQDKTSLLVGFDAAPMNSAELELWRQLIWSAGFACLLGTLGLLWTRLRKRQGFLAQALEQVHSYHRILLERMNDAVLAWEPKEGLTFWNRQAESLWPELKQLHPGEAPPPRVLSTSGQTQKSGGQAVLPLISGGDKRNFQAVYETIASPIPTHILFLTDVTAVEQAADERHRREQLEALARIASGVAHEVRNPLNAMDMNIQTLLMEPSTLQPQDKETLRDVREEIARINRIVEHFLAYGRPQPPIFSELDLNEIVSEAADFLQPLIHDRHIQLRMETQDAEPILADAQQIRQVLLNIVLNAVEAMESGGEILLSVKQENGEAVFACSDAGVGMTSEQLTHLFDPYYTSKPKGTGLGMSIVKRIMDAHDGEIAVSSQPGKGTEVVLRFKILAASIAGQKETEA